MYVFVASDLLCMVFVYFLCFRFHANDDILHFEIIPANNHNRVSYGSDLKLEKTILIAFYNKHCIMLIMIVVIVLNVMPRVIPTRFMFYYVH